MSMSLRDQLLAAGLVSQKQVREAERQQQQQERAQQQSKQKRPPSSHHKQAAQPSGHEASVNTASGNAAASVAAASAHSGPAHSGAIAGASVRNASAQSAKVARDLALNKKQQEKAQQKARAAQVKQLIEQNRVPRGEGDERYNFVDAGRVRFVAANAEIRRRLMAGELFIVRHDGVYEVVPAAIAQRIRERDELLVINAAATATSETPPVEDAYKDFAVPDDLMW